jgi:hypothetical protein
VSAKAGWRTAIGGFFSENIWLKVVSIVFAVGLYSFIHGAGDAQRTFSVSVLSLMPPDSANRQLLTPLPTEVGITLRGSHTQLDDLHQDELGSLRLDLRSGRETRIDLEPRMFHIPAGLTVEQIIPASIKVRWDDVVERPIPIQVPRTGEPAPGLSIKGAITSDPDTVVARGPRSVVDVMQFARSAPFDVTGLTEGTHTHPLALDKPPTLVTFDVEAVSATVDIAREMKTKPFAKLKVEVVGLPKGKTKPAFVEIDVTGPTDEVNDILPESIVPRVEPKDAEIDTTKPGSAMLDVLVDVPHVKVEVKPPKVLVTW